MVNQCYLKIKEVYKTLKNKKNMQISDLTLSVFVKVAISVGSDVDIYI